MSAPDADTGSATPFVSTKETYKEDVGPRKIKQLQFGLMSPDEIMQVSELHVFERNLYKKSERKPYPDSVLDTRLGVSNKLNTCETCGQKLADCSGHFGYIKLQLPVFHVGYFKSTLQTLQCICKSCSRVLLPEEDRQRMLRQFRSPRLERTQRAGLFKRVIDKCKRMRVCTACGDVNGTVKKITGGLKIIHDKYSKNFGEYSQYVEQFNEAVRHNEQVKTNLSKIADDLNPIRVLALFIAIPEEDCELLDLYGRPEHLILTHLPVPPVCIRPSVEVDGGAGTNEDDITIKLTTVLDVNNIVQKALVTGMPIALLMEHWEFLQDHCALYFNSDLPGLALKYSPGGGKKPTRGFVQRLKGKQGRFRGNLSGKRVDFSGRTVISPDPNLRVDEVAIPLQMATTLTFPERVTAHNIEALRRAIINGKGMKWPPHWGPGMGTWPGANFVEFPGGGRWFLKYGDRRRIAADLKHGDTVERHLRNGDVVLFNRQPSLHRMSIMAHRARIRPWRTLRFNECVCAPYNADFDGDEMNLHVPQTEEARAEAAQLMGVTSNLATPKNGEILIAATQDFLTSAFLLTAKDRLMDRGAAGALAAAMGDAEDPVDLPPPAIFKPLELWTGKQIFSLLLRPTAITRIFVTLETAEKMYCKGREHLCPNDAFVAFRNSELLCGRLGKATLGGGNKAGLFQVLSTDFSARAAAAVMGRLAKLSARFIGERGFSIGVDDVTPAPLLDARKREAISSSYAECQSYIASYNAGKLELMAGCNMEQSLEQRVMGVLNRIRGTASEVCMSTLHYHNAPLIMSQCGSKGSPINIAQMVACVGQQSVGGRRCPDGFLARTLPHFPRGDRTPEGKGFVAASFYSGLSPSEFFFHTMAGREGLVDTAVKTAETGYMSRRLMKALEDLYTHYDGTVRNAAGGIVQLVYGDDGLDPVAMEDKTGAPVDLSRLLAAVRALQPPGAPSAAAAAQLGGAMHTDDPPSGSASASPMDVDAEGSEVPLPGEMAALAARVLAEEGLAAGGEAGCSQAFCDSLADFLAAQVTAWGGLRSRLGLPIVERGNAALEAAAARVASLTPAQLRSLVRACAARYYNKRMDPGSTVGAVGAQSIGEPGTQMTLKTFHFAGVASMNVTQGVPRIKEIINASKTISTPIINVALSVDTSEASARFVKARLERTVLGQVARQIRAVLRPAAGRFGAYIGIQLNLATINTLQLSVSAASVREALIAAPKLRLKMPYVLVKGEDVLEVRLQEDLKPGALLFQLQALLTALPAVIVAGIPSIERAVVALDDKAKTYGVICEGRDLGAVMGTLGVAGERCESNSVIETERVLGIEAARTTIMSEIGRTMGSHGMQIDARHTMLLADCMTYKGEVLGITRFGIAKMKDSVLMLASFEKTTDHLFEAALHGRADDITGVSESIIMGIPMPTGTGLFKLRQASASLMLPPPRHLPVLAA